MKLMCFVWVGATIIWGALSTATGQTSFYEQVTSMWLAGNKAGVLAIAEQRLQNDTNDMAGLLLKMEYEMEFVELGALSNTMQRVLSIGAQIATPNFASIFPLVQEDISALIEALPYYPNDEIAGDIEKADIANKPLESGDAILALQDDGYFQ